MSRNKERYNAYQKEYQLRLYHKKMTHIIEQLGGKCVKCGATENLEVDHIDPSTKRMTITKLWGYSIEQLNAELAKCQLLCNECHKEKSIIEQSHPIIFRGIEYPSKQAAVQATKIGWAKFYKEYMPL